MVALARPGLLRRPAIRRELRRLERSPCYRNERLTRSDRRATIFLRLPSCPKLNAQKTPDALDDANAVAILHGVVVFISADDCERCHGPISRYETLAGMRRLVLALRPRPPRFPPAPTD